MAEINDLNIVDASNTARQPEGMQAGAVNNGIRALEGILARWHNDINGTLTAGGTADVLTLSANQTLTAYYDGLMLRFGVATSNTGSATLNVDSLGAKTIKKLNRSGKANLAEGDLRAGSVVDVVYDGTDFLLLARPLAPNRHAVFAYNTSNDNNVTGAGTVATVDFNTASLDQSSAFAADTYTVPEDGIYSVSAHVQVSVPSTGSEIILTFLENARPWMVDRREDNSTDGLVGVFNVGGTVMMNLSAGDTIKVQLEVNGVGSDTADILGQSAASGFITYFSCYRIGDA